MQTSGTTNQTIAITIEHVLPGRMRCRLSHLPSNWNAMREAIIRHEGIELLHLTPITRSVLVVHDSQIVSREEIIIRLSVVLSDDHGGSPVRLVTKPTREDLTPFSMFSGLMTAAAGASRFVPGLSSIRTAAEITSSIAVSTAVVSHGYREVVETGSFDPEVLSVIYLLYSLTQGRGLSASLITWIASFGRHLLTPQEESVLLSIRAGKPDDETSEPSYHVAVRPDRSAPRFYTFIKYAQAALADTLAGGSFGRDQLINRIRDVSTEHDSILEGIGAKLENTINIQIDK